MSRLAVGASGAGQLEARRPRVGERDARLLRDLYGRQKSLALGAGAALALGRAPTDALANSRRLAGECERAASTDRGELGPHFDACREAALRLVDMLADAEHRGAAPSRTRLQAARASHSRLRHLIWEIFTCEYIPCSAHGTREQSSPAAGAFDHRQGGSHA